MEQCPVLGRVPSSFDTPLTIKATHTGITILQERAYRKRYAGSKQCAIDINGNLFLSAKELEARIKADKKPDKVRAKKKQGCPPALVDYSLLTEASAEPISNGLRGQMSDNILEPAKKERRKTCYSVNKKEVRGRLLSYINTQRGAKQLYFWTVSFPEGTPDDICYQAFNTWLTSLRKYKLLKDYLWVAERQDGARSERGRATNTIHFHLAIPHKMPVQRANAMMRGTLKTFAVRGAIPYTKYSPQIAKYNGVDIAKHRTTKRVTNFAIKKGARALATYLSKYVTKNDAQFEHLAWHNSRGFSCLFTAVTFTIDEFKKFGFGQFLNRVRVFEMRFAKFVPWLYGPPPLLMDHLFKLNTYIQSTAK